MHSVRIFLAGVLITLANASPLGAQNVNDDFDKFAQGIEADFQRFTDSINATFSEFLKQNWEPYELHSATEPPAYLNGVKMLPGKGGLSRATFGFPAEEDAGGVDFFGNMLPNRTDKPPAVLNDLSERAVGDFWKELSASDKVTFFSSLKEDTEHLGLNFWGVLLYVNRYFSGEYAMDSDTDVVYTVFLLNRLGYRCRMGRKEGRLVLLACLNAEIYSVPYILLGGEPYYLFEQRINYGIGSRERSETRNAPVYTYARDYDLARSPCNMSFPQKHRIRDVLRFYHYYPLCEMKIYLHAGWSDYSVSFFERARKEIEGKGISLAVDKREFTKRVLDFVSCYPHYVTDRERWGRERFFFTDEWVHYKESDCEDNSIALYSFLKYCAGPSPLLVLFEGHAAVAVDLPPLPGESSIRYKGKDFLLCDPSFKGAGIGKLVPGVKINRIVAILE